MTSVRLQRQPFDRTLLVRTANHVVYLGNDLKHAAAYRRSAALNIHARHQLNLSNYFVNLFHRIAVNQVALHDNERIICHRILAAKALVYRVYLSVIQTLLCVDADKCSACRDRLYVQCESSRCFVKIQDCALTPHGNVSCKSHQ
jgi:hypothetical protein